MVAVVAAAGAPSAAAAPSAASADHDPVVVIIGGGIGGLAAAVALQARGIKCRVFDRDESYGQRKGYGLTLSNATALAALGLEDETMAVRASVLVGADGVRSACRALKVGDPLRYVGVVVVLGVSTFQHPLLHEQGFYTVDGSNRLFTMPYEPLHDDSGRHTTMWQLSFALKDEEEARRICGGGGEAVLAEIVRRCGEWHAPVPQMLAATEAATVWGTPLFDRAPMPLRKKKAQKMAAAATRGGGQYAPWHSRVTLMGDAAHCMTPFKGQGANQALADAPLLAKYLAPALRAGGSNVASALSTFEREMADRAEAKVKASRAAAGTYHSLAAVDPLSYGIEGVDKARLAIFLDTLRERGIGAASCCSEEEEDGDLAQKAVEVAREISALHA